MRSTDPSPAELPPRRSARFLDLRNAYHARLASDCAQLDTLRGVLERSDPGERAPYADIQRAAHRMAGTAAVFGATEVSAAAAVLEEAALAGVAAPGDLTSAAVLAALGSLQRLIVPLIP